MPALRELGVADMTAEGDGFPPVRLRAEGIRGGKAVLTGGESSQYLSSLLLAAPYAAAEVEVAVSGSVVSRPYVDLTVEVMSRFGVEVQRQGYSAFRVPTGRGYRATHFPVEGDASSAGQRAAQ